MIPEDLKETIRQRTDIVQLIGSKVKLAKAGAEFVGLCPFHTEKSPSFHVVPAKGMFHCFGCGKTGDVFAFLMEHGGLSFVQAAETLARDCGLSLPAYSASRPMNSRDGEARRYQPPAADPGSQMPDTGYPSAETGAGADPNPASGIRHPASGPKPKALNPDDYEAIPEGDPVWTYLMEKRGFGMCPGVLDVYGLKMVKRSLLRQRFEWLAKEGRGIPPEWVEPLVEQGAIAFPYHERVERRRKLEDTVTIEWKWRFNKVLCVFRPGGKKIEWRKPSGAQSFLFGMQTVPEEWPEGMERSLVICEGEMDALSWRAYGHDAVSVPNGAGALNWVEPCWDWLARFKTIYLSFDEDRAGRAAVREAVARLGIERTGIVRLPEKQ